MSPLRSLLADNPGPFTHEGTRTYIRGRRQVVVIDPGPDLPAHVDAVVRTVAHADRVTLALTHGHGDHAGGLETLLDALPAAEVAGAGHRLARPLSDGDTLESDAGSLIALHTPGHTRDHLAFHWPEASSLFAGDMVLGVGDTTWVAEYSGCVADYLASLTRLEGLPLERVYPAHGPDQSDPPSLWARYRAHREQRIEQVRDALAEDPDAPLGAILERVYGEAVPPNLRGAAERSLQALVDHVTAHPAARP